MEALQKLTLYIHILAGFTALTVGLIPMFAKKGGKLHINAGRIYVWAMYLVSSSALVTYIIKPYRPFLLFLAFIGIFSFYLTYTGVQATKQKKEILPTLNDWIISGIGLLAGICMIGLAVWNFTAGNTSFAILYAVFGVFYARIASHDLQVYRKKAIPEKTAWFFLHMGRIMGAYLATLTAFCVVNAAKVEFIPPLVAWIAPGVIGGIGIGVWTRYYRKKMKVA
ncbi:DUF2306 domain-containing protein [Xanthocytophaga agilis]|uniref:DUF2306 domain-containing protein n=1 Tax=Xanthocytophaga agilis TaxID=3048010 RepID=A0AAE3R878_9BACT|nr:DUF2306 domain-containing protein [Xanthocytophaga agilis]MDJ1505476.1 DUF2306 domain-containing protein [Xanthocytophaga agilis]